jgi:hypothetical protein
MPSTPTTRSRHRIQHPLDEEGTVVFTDLGQTWNDTITRLMSGGFTFHEAALWASVRAPRRRNNDLLVVHAAWYRASGFNVPEAVEWFWNGIHADDAVTYANRGWTPAQAALLRRRLHEAEPSRPPIAWHAPYTEPHDAETWWLITRIPPARVLRYVAAGCTDHEASLLEHTRSLDTTIDDAVGLLAALRASPST